MNSTFENRRVLSRAETAHSLNISMSTLARLHDRGEGPKQIRLSKRKLGYRWSDIQEWLEQRENTLAV